MSLVSFIGPRPNLFDLDGTSRRKRLEVAPADPHQRGPGEDPLHQAICDGLASVTATIDITYPAAKGAAGLEEALDSILCRCAPKPPCTVDTTSSSCPIAHGRPGPHPDPGAAGHAPPCTTT